LAAATQLPAVSSAPPGRSACSKIEIGRLAARPDVIAGIFSYLSAEVENPPVLCIMDKKVN
jgi:hypothetical protein